MIRRCKAEEGGVPGHIDRRQRSSGGFSQAICTGYLSKVPCFVEVPEILRFARDDRCVNVSNWALAKDPSGGLRCYLKSGLLMLSMSSKAWFSPPMAQMKV